MQITERIKVLRSAKPKYVVYWHHLRNHDKPESQGYIGVTHTQSSRFSKLTSGYKSNEKFMKAILDNGEDNIITTILYDGLTKSEAETLEQKLRPETDIGWNIRQGGGNNAKQSLISNEKNRKAKEGVEYPYDKIFTPETRKKISLSKMGNKNRLGMHNSEEMRRKQSISAKKNGISEKTRMASYKKVLCIETGIIYQSQVEAEKETGVLHKLISQSCHNSKRTAGGYHWRLV